MSDKNSTAKPEKPKGKGPEVVDLTPEELKRLSGGAGISAKEPAGQRPQMPPAPPKPTVSPPKSEK
jgi:hypothetical protein